MFKMIGYYVKDYPVVYILSLATLALVIWVVVRMIQSRRTEKLHAISSSIGVIPLLAGLIAAAGFLTETLDIVRAIQSLSTSGTGDPKVVAAGLAEAFISITVTGILFFFFLEAWLVIRMIYLKFINELEPLSQPRP
jgi:hypothetical protein